MIAFRHILVPVDFEPCSQRALEVAIDLALQFDSRLTLVHAYDLPGYMYASTYVPPYVWDWLKDTATQQLTVTLAEVHKRIPRAESALLRGSAGAEILAAVERLKPDLVVVGTHGRRGLSRVFLGSVAEKIVRGCPVPVLSVHGGDE
jgi:nucleotide-binding universal stress UspA family protein